MKKEVKQSVLISMIVSYNFVSLENIKNGHVVDKELQRLIKKIEKIHNKLAKKPLINQKRDIIIAEKKVKELFEIDKDFFKGKEYSSLVMEVLLIDVVYNLLRDTTMKTLFMDVDTKKYIYMVEKGYPETARSHHRCITAMIERLGL